jgi:hypothetical protein
MLGKATSSLRNMSSPAVPMAQTIPTLNNLDHKKRIFKQPSMKTSMAIQDAAFVQVIDPFPN